MTSTDVFQSNYTGLKCTRVLRGQISSIVGDRIFSWVLSGQNIAKI